MSLKPFPFRLLPPFAASLLLFALVPAPACAAQASGDPALSGEAPAYADLAVLADAAPVVVKVRVARQTPVPAERAPGLRDGHMRLFVEADTLAALSAPAALPARLAYLVDVAVDGRGRAPKLKKREFIVFARPVAGRPGELQLVGPSAQLAWSTGLETALRPVLTAFAAADAPPRVTGVRDVLSSRGNLAGESETQVFLATATGAPASITVIRRPGQAPRWGVSWSELVDQSARAPARNTLAWFRLACSLPATLPAGAQLSEDTADRERARADYGFVIESLGPCTRNLG